MSVHRHRIGLNRREVIQVGYSALLGASLTQVANGAPRKAPKSVLIVFTTGAMSHLDTLDPKPDAPPEVRGEFGVTETTVPGVRITDQLPLLAKHADKYALVRTLAHKDNNHTAATHHLITGTLQPFARFDKPLSRDDHPCYAAGVSATRPPAAGIPAGVTLPTFLQEGPLVWPGQHGGFLGPKHDPWQVTSDPTKPDFSVGDLRPIDGLDVDTLGGRRSLLATMTAKQRAMAESAAGRKLTDQQEKAFDLLTSGAVAKAFDLSKVPDAEKDRYGRHLFGQSILLARRLVEAGVPVVQANMGRVQNWDTHGNNFSRLKKDLLPPLDRGVSALLEDLAASGRLATTLVIVIGEFGRSPKLQGKDGRDHWAPCFSGLFAGGGVRGGQVVGRSDAQGAYPSTVPYSPDDVGATVYDALGVPADVEVRDRVNRPVALNRGQVIRSLYTGS